MASPSLAAVIAVAAWCWNDCEVIPRVQGQRSPIKTVGTGAVVARFRGHFEEIPHVQGQRRSPNKMVEVVKSHLESNPTSNRNAEGSNKPCVHQDPETPQRLSQHCV